MAQSKTHGKSVQQMSTVQLLAVAKSGSLLAAAAKYLLEQKGVEWRDKKRK
jgi:hypothetical protein